MNINDLTIGQIKELKSIVSGDLPSNNSPFKVGENYFIRTVTMYLIGKVESVGDKELVLSSASWVADSGRYHDALKTGKLNEVEPYLNEVIVGRGAIVDATLWAHKNPAEQK